LRASISADAASESLDIFDPPVAQAHAALEFVGAEVVDPDEVAEPQRRIAQRRLAAGLEQPDDAVAATDEFRAAAHGGFGGSRCHEQQQASQRGARSAQHDSPPR
jgi:hypothetical protein